tara:strand:+ start:295 stop:675 length:381 start_codon:yes stop_codon:yes gene_type:complete
MSKNIISVTIPALKKLSAIAKDNNCKHLLFSIKGGGCNGFTYKFSPSNDQPEEMDEVHCLKKKIKELDQSIKTPLESIHVCGKSLIHILGTEIDWKKDIMGETFVFTNPMAQSSCGCGTSFNSKNE